MGNISRLRDYAFRYFQPFFRSMGWLFFVLLLAQVVAALSPYIFGKIIDAIFAKAPLVSVLYFVLLLFGVAVMEKVLSYASSIIEIRFLDCDVARHISRSSLERLLTFSFGQHVSEHSGLKQNILRQGELAFKNMVNNLIYVLIPLVLQVCVISVILLSMSPFVGVVLLFGIALFVVFSAMLNRKFVVDIRHAQEADRQVDRHYSEIIRNLPLIKVSGKEDDALNEWGARRLHADELEKSVWSRYMLFSEGRNFTADIAKCGIIAFGVYLVYSGAHTAGELVTLLGWSSSAFNQLGRVGGLQRKFMDDLGHIDRYVEAVSQEPAVKESPSATALPYIRGDIGFHRVCFSYSKNTHKEGEDCTRDTLTDVSFQINAGETVALVGHSGAGKTTIVNLLLRGYDPDDGQITIDGHDVRLVRGDEYRRHIGYVPQHVELFDETLAYNILFGVPVSEQAQARRRLERVAEDACIDRFYNRLGPSRFETIIGERGVRLSGGEQQRVGIARALIKNPHIIIFDEATSNLDADSEAVIHEATKRALKGRTGIIIAHRLSTVVDVDRIIVVERGQIADVGTHEELLGRSLNYRSLVEKQMKSLGTL